ncbi:restriction endonuclease subunit S [Methylotuvimicrobium sp.]|uniref:restriction endonuclease subunit S n=1 Tax=Methylotuvimicrobium sp. TaxID=2822413 RepID=UPI003D65ABB4
MISVVEIPKYESYKDSENEWFSVIPEHWKCIRLKYSLKLVSEKIVSAKSGLPYIGMENIESWSGKILGDNSDVEGLASGFEPSDILFGKLRPYLAKVAIPDFRGTCSTEFLVYRATNGQPQYFRYLLGSKSFINLIDSSTYGSKMPRASSDFIGNQYIPVPSSQEQIFIANFLDIKTAQIDEAIAIKQQQISLLKERKQIIIQQAVTQGLDPNVPMKDSGVDWIGMIPENWEVLANRTLFIERVESGREGLPLLSVSIHSGVSSEEVSEEDNVRRRVKIEDKTKYVLVKKGDVAFNMMRAWQGGIGAVTTDGMVSPAYIVAKPIGAIVADFFEYQYRCPKFIQQMDRYSKGITDFRKRLYWDGFKQLKTVVPPKKEQEKIIQFIQDLATKTEAADKLLNAQIEKLKEYKTTLINSAVTGKIKITPEMIGYV